jgi:hypothetical protein
MRLPQRIEKGPGDELPAHSALADAGTFTTGRSVYQAIIAGRFASRS